MADILIGLGGTGGKILKAFRQRLWTEFDKQQRARLPIFYLCGYGQRHAESQRCQL